MAEEKIKLEKKIKEQDPAYHAVLEDFRNHCKQIITHYDEDDEIKNSEQGAYSTLGQRYNLNTDSPKTEPLENELISLCAELAFWIYEPHLVIPKPVQFKDDDFAHWHYKKIIKSQRTQIAQWAFLQFSAEPKNAYLIFKGTDPDKIFDIMADTAVIPMPIWCKEDATDTTNKMDKNQKLRLSQQFSNSDLNKILNEADNDIDDDEWQFCGHSGIYATLMRDFHRIWKIINCRIAMFDTLYVVGHSLGGGLAILFGLESIINKFVPQNKEMKIITFGTPVVISYENDYNSLSKHAKKILYQLHNICHCYVNRFDPVPRVPARIEWMMTVIPYALRKIIADQVKIKMKLPGFLVPLVKSGVKNGVSKFVQYVEKYLDLLQSYHPIGTYYFFAGKDCDEPFITKNQTVIQELLGFIPPHKIVTSDGQELRVSHYSTKVHGIKHDSRFSLANVTELTSPDEQKKDNDKQDEEKIDILNLLIKRSKSMNGDNECEGTVYDNAALYVAVETDDDKVMDQYRAKKFSEKGWIMLVSNHLMEQYIDIFKAKMQNSKSKYPLLAPKNAADINHFAAPENTENTENKDDTDTTEQLTAAMYATASLLKSTGKKWWNQAKDKYQKDMDERNQKKKEESAQKGYPGVNSNKSGTNVVNPNIAQIQPQPQASQYYYVQPPQQLSGQSQQSQQSQQPAQYQPYQPYQQYQQYYQPQYVPQQQGQQQVVYIQQPTNLSGGQQIGSTQYRIAQQPTHYVIYPQQPQQPQPQQPQPQQKQPSNNSLYPSLAKK